MPRCTARKPSFSRYDALEPSESASEATNLMEDTSGMNRNEATYPLESVPAAGRV